MTEQEKGAEMERLFEAIREQERAKVVAYLEGQSKFHADTEAMCEEGSVKATHHVLARLYDMVAANIFCKAHHEVKS